MLDVLVLGPVRALVDGRDCPISGLKQRGLLARLALARGRPLRAERLIAELWDDLTPRDPLHALHAQVSRLRSAVPIDIEFADDGYRLDPAAYETDVARFERLCEHGDSLLAEGNLEDAAARLHEALGLWRGDIFSGLHSSSALLVEAKRLEERRSIAHADRLDVDLALGRSDELLPELHALVEEQPFHERHWGQLMTALYRMGRTPEALQVFTRAREIFADRLGVEPSGELCGVHTQILRGEPSDSLLRLASDSTALSRVTPRTLTTTVTAEDILTSSRPEIVMLLLNTQKAILVTGEAGVGKTHLLRTVAAAFKAQHDFAPLLSASPLSAAIPLGVFAGSVGSFPRGHMSPGGLIDHYVRQRSRATLLVDDVNELDASSLFVITHLIQTARLPALLSVRDFDSAPEEVQALYDSGDLTHLPMSTLSVDEADQLAAHLVGGALTPDTRPRIHNAARGNPLHLREIITGSRHDGRLVSTEHGWELQGSPTPTPRLARLLGHRFDGVSDAAVDAAALVAIAGEYPATALPDAERRVLARADIVERSGRGWVRLSHPLDEGFLRTRYSHALWHEFTQEVVHVLRSEATEGRLDAQRRAHVLAIDLTDEIDVAATIRLAEHALGSFDARLALRAAQAVVAREPESARGHRLAGQAASALGFSATADEHFDHARSFATNETESVATALARSRHLGVQHHDASAALAVIDDALTSVEDPDSAAHLQRARMRWAAVAGHGSDKAPLPAEAPDAQTSDAETAQGMITLGVSGVITGPLDDSLRMIFSLRSLPSDLVDLVPGGAALIALTEVMALSNTGDVVATRQRLERMITEAREHQPETLGMWEYALGFSHLLSGDATAAYRLGHLAAAHLAWRDAAGLLPASHALAAAGARATGQHDEARRLFDEMLPASLNDPKVIMLRAWSDARRFAAENLDSDAAETLVTAGRWLLAVQHTYFAGMLAHCAVRLGSSIAEASALIDEAAAIAGGGLLDVFARHATATRAGDTVALETVADQAHELGMTTTAVDTWTTLLRSPFRHRLPEAKRRQLRAKIDRAREQVPSMVLWTQTPGPAR
ncbi:transcriptional regulator [Microbacterium sp. MPKO10]|uniref:transcriptional regulator n=1 Tax=Microbacterium sp. MPKO10 TaxID=2989818 RepID=UPI0022368BCA|nr:transcriptional regulator [Microbacterium sp. MPKO10]MCW4457732.1 transcriptional regulator [Microbacterium sp. MPKO10]